MSSPNNGSGAATVSPSGPVPHKPTNEPIWLGIGSPQPQSRVKQNSVFGHVADAFDEKSIYKIGQLSVYDQKKKAAEMRAERERGEREQGERGGESKGGESGDGGREVAAGGVRSEGGRMDGAMDPRTEATQEVSAGDGGVTPGVTISSGAGSAATPSGVGGLLIRGGRVVNDDQSFDADVFIVNNVIKEIGADMSVPDDVTVIDATGCYVMPGGIDTNTRFSAVQMGTQSVDDFYHGTKAALCGGTTMIIDYVTSEWDESLLQAYDRTRLAADKVVCCDYALRADLSSWSDSIAADMEILFKEKGVNTFHIRMGNLSDSDLYKAMNKCKQLGALAQVHLENGFIATQKSRELIEEGITGPEGHLLSHPEEVEAEAVNRAIILANQAQCPAYVSQVTGKSVADIIARSRRKGMVVFGECLCASIALDASQYYNENWRYAAGHVTSPPLRPGLTTSTTLVDLLSNGDLQVVSSSHCTFNSDQKALGKDDFRKIPSGINGVEERMSVVWQQTVCQGRMDPCRFVSATSSTAAKIFNIYPSKGRIAIGSDADIVVWDPSAVTTLSATTHHSRCDFNVFDGMSCHGTSRYVISGGVVVKDQDGEIRVSEGNGKFVSMRCGSEFLYNKIWTREKNCRPRPIERSPPAMGLDDGRVKGPRGDRGGTPSRTLDSMSKDLTDEERRHIEVHCRPATSSGGRNMQDSTFSFSGTTYITEVDDGKGKRTCGARISQPPGGKTTQLW